MPIIRKHEATTNRNSKAKSTNVSSRGNRPVINDHLYATLLIICRTLNFAQVSISIN